MNNDAVNSHKETLEEQLHEHMEQLRAYDRQTSCGFAQAGRYAAYHRKEVERLRRMIAAQAL